MKRKPFEALSPPPPSKPLPHPANLPKEFKEEDERLIATTIEDERLTVTTIKKDHHHHDNNYAPTLNSPDNSTRSSRRKMKD